MKAITPLIAVLVLVVVLTMQHLSPPAPRVAEPAAPTLVRPPHPYKPFYVTDWQPLRNVGNLGPVVTDIESHLPAGNVYQDADPITWCHEGTHGINSILRNRMRMPTFYVLNNRAVPLPEPATTLSAVAQVVPATLRGDVYGLYLVEAQSDWNEQPSYVFDEWSAYINGSDCRFQRGIQDRGETVQYMAEMSVYSICVAAAAKSADPQLRLFLMYQLERCVKLSRGRTTAFDSLRLAGDAEGLRQFCRSYFGSEFTQSILGF